MRNKLGGKTFRDERYSTKLAACGNRPIVDYTDNNSPVVDNITFKTMLIL